MGDPIRRFCFHTGKYESEKTSILTYFIHWFLPPILMVYLHFYTKSSKSNKNLSNTHLMYFSEKNNYFLWLSIWTKEVQNAKLSAIIVNSLNSPHGQKYILRECDSLGSFSKILPDFIDRMMSAGRDHLVSAVRNHLKSSSGDEVWK